MQQLEGNLRNRCCLVPDEDFTHRIEKRGGVIGESSFVFFFCGISVVSVGWFRLIDFGKVGARLIEGWFD